MKRNQIIITVIFVVVLICGSIIFFMYKDQILETEKSKIKKGKCGELETDCTPNISRPYDFECRGEKCTKRECCVPKGVCTTNICNDNQVLKPTQPDCVKDLCTQDECCVSKGTCVNSPGICVFDDGYIPKQNPKEFCEGIECNVDECCDIYRDKCNPQICANDNALRTDLPDDYVCQNKICTDSECCTTKGQCTIDFDCGANHIIKDSEDFPEFCVGVDCDINDCCIKDTCNNNPNICSSRNLNEKTNFGNIMCEHMCKVSECCEIPKLNLRMTNRQFVLGGGPFYTMNSVYIDLRDNDDNKIMMGTDVSFIVMTQEKKFNRKYGYFYYEDTSGTPSRIWDTDTNQWVIETGTYSTKDFTNVHTLNVANLFDFTSVSNRLDIETWFSTSKTYRLVVWSKSHPDIKGTYSPDFSDWTKRNEVIPSNISPIFQSTPAGTAFRFSVSVSSSPVNPNTIELEVQVVDRQLDQWTDVALDGNPVNQEEDFRLRLQKRVKNEMKGITEFEFVDFNYGPYVGKTNNEILAMIYPLSIDDEHYNQHRTGSNGSATITGPRDWNLSNTIYRIIAYSPTSPQNLADSPHPQPLPGELIGGISANFS
jgi:hypothetical protein